VEAASWRLFQLALVHAKGRNDVCAWGSHHVIWRCHFGTLQEDSCVERWVYSGHYSGPFAEGHSAVCRSAKVLGRLSALGLEASARQLQARFV
jgi:hypothetical protein